MSDITSADSATAGSLESPALPIGPVSPVTKRPATEAKVAELIDKWLADESGYDEQVWPQLKAALETNRSGSRRLFDG